VESKKQNEIKNGHDHTYRPEQFWESAKTQV
jgi:hypothetical protein